MDLAQLRQSETDHIERKRSPQDSEGILHAVCALANDLGGSGMPGRLVVTVAPYAVPPVVMVDGVGWVRQGSSTRRATQADLQRLSERRPEHSQPFDLRPVATATLEDLDRHLLKARYDADRIGDEDEESFPSLEQWLTQRQWGRPVAGTWHPNPAALLLYGLGE